MGDVSSPRAGRKVARKMWAARVRVEKSLLRAAKAYHGMCQAGVVPELPILGLTFAIKDVSLTLALVIQLPFKAVVAADVGEDAGARKRQGEKRIAAVAARAMVGELSGSVGCWRLMEAKEGATAAAIEEGAAGNGCGSKRLRDNDCGAGSNGGSSSVSGEGVEDGGGRGRRCGWAARR
ncbi:hypothetical protein BHM03_00006180 [Ensete ventricosum]|nr:hypothetical protein BHM03_00006180 [Ensete ventricosum]